VTLSVVLSITVTFLSDIEIIEYVQRHDMISPFIDKTIHGVGHLSYGLAQSSYEVRIEPAFRLFDPGHTATVDPIAFDSAVCESIQADELIMPPHSFALCVTLEEFNLPQDVTILCLGKSTYARCGIIVNPTVVNPGMQGKIVIELSNTAPNPVRVRAGDNGVAKLVFGRSLSDARHRYDGAYQNQQGIVLPRNRG